VLKRLLGRGIVGKKLWIARTGRVLARLDTIVGNDQQTTACREMHSKPVLEEYLC